MHGTSYTINFIWKSFFKDIEFDFPDLNLIEELLKKSKFQNISEYATYYYS
jgi:hypothetical protein